MQTTGGHLPSEPDTGMLNSTYAPSSVQRDSIILPSTVADSAMVRKNGHCHTSQHIIRLVKVVQNELAKKSYGTALEALNRLLAIQGAVHTQEFLCHLLQKRGSLGMEHVEWCLEKMIEQHVPLEQQSLNAMLFASAKAGNGPSAEKWLKMMQSHGRPPGILAFNALIHACAVSLDTERAERAVGMMMEQSIDPNSVTYASLVQAFAKKGKLHRAEFWAQRMETAGEPLDRTVFDDMLQVSAKVGNQVKAEKWIRRLIEDGLQVETPELNNLLLACARSGDLQRASQWLQFTVTSSSVQVDLDSFRCVISAAAKAASSEEANFWMEELLSQGFRPNLVCYNAALSACSRDRSYPRALYWVLHMLLLGEQPDKVTFNTMIHASMLSGTQLDAEFWLMRMVHEGHRPDRITFSTLTNSRSLVEGPGALPTWAVLAIAAARRLQSPQPSELALLEGLGGDDEEVKLRASVVCSGLLQDHLRRRVGPADLRRLRTTLGADEVGVGGEEEAEAETQRTLSDSLRLHGRPDAALEGGLRCWEAAGVEEHHLQLRANVGTPSLQEERSSSSSGSWSRMPMADRDGQITRVQEIPGERVWQL